MANGSIDNWLDYLIRRWPVVAVVGVLVMGVAKTSWVQNAQASDISDLKGAITEIKSYNEQFRREYREDQNSLDSKLTELLKAVKTN